ncbi:MAG: Hsp20/alpha crystallin family protein [Planctomycetes bacterium]|nr:Hsp20/alpha crystallin family protein [Planctomycetota bacterium]
MNHLSISDPFRELVSRAITDDTSMGEWLPRIDYYESESAYQVNADLPGIEKDNVDVTYENKILTLSGEKKVESTEGNYANHRVERAFGRFTRSIHLPKDVNIDGIKAEMKNGVLHIEIPKAESAQAKKILISSQEVAS